MSPSHFVVAYICTIAAVMASVAGLTTMARRASRAARTAAAAESNNTRFFGSQVGGQSIINYSYTDMPYRLMAFDAYYFFKFIWALPYIVFPLTPADSGELSELAFTRKNMFSLAMHLVLCLLQLAFIVALPLMALLPVWTAALAIGLFFLVNDLLCRLLNGSTVEYHSDPEYASALPEHGHEQWIFINGVAAGEHWMKSNLNRLALTFKRPILGIHNKTNGILFDVIECLIQRNLAYATTDVRVCYRIIKEKLYNPQYSKVVFILHSQGGIEGSLILDWLLQELPQNLLAKLEVYTFGNASNHFNNPHRHIYSQDAAKRNPLAASTDSANLAAARQVNGDFPSNHTTTEEPEDNISIAIPPPNLLTSETSALSPSAISGRVIGHIEHYAHTSDFVALWGVLHFATSAPGTHSLPRYIGRVFARTSTRGGHQFVQHYLDGMFPLARDSATGKLIGCAEENEFMESEVVLGVAGDEERNHHLREIIDSDAVEVHSVSPVLQRRQPQSQRGRLRNRLEGSGGGSGAVVGVVKVKQLSRLWEYRNGRSPEEKPPLLPVDADGVVRMATM
ncbi:hypothetical protein B0H66DRAFT_472946 [Apodospora peruviana]|uniref:Uncharacterized protein n=1 Tax=Apodospora peruviana TaxID=516989 RepID=A0AAE0M6Z6_9PEZI|nr:hypothetical protein B0H66DRAFT_472946 [Apodospora peruviana]